MVGNTPHHLARARAPCLHTASNSVCIQPESQDGPDSESRSQAKIRESGYDQGPARADACARHLCVLSYGAPGWPSRRHEGGGGSKHAVLSIVVRFHWLHMGYFNIGSRSRSRSLLPARKIVGSHSGLMV